MSKRIIYNKCVYERVGNVSAVHAAQMDAIANAVYHLARQMNADGTHEIRDDVVEILAEVKDRVFGRIPKK